MTTFTQRFTNLELSRTARIQYGLIGIWVLAMISLPILKWTRGEQIIPTAVTGALLVQFSAVFYVVQAKLGLRQTSIMLGLVAAATWGIEFVGSSTGFPFGAYDYTDVLQPQLGHVPLLIPAAWFMMLPSAWTVAQLIAGRERFWPYVGMSAVAITAWDLFLDPQMVDWGFWVWANPEGYFDIPWTNYAGWLLTGVVVTLLVRPQRFDLPVFPLLLIYGIVWFLQTFGQAFFWGQVGPAIVGGVVMGGLLIWSVIKLSKAAH
jgi:lycopene beta-cyclase